MHGSLESVSLFDDDGILVYLTMITEAILRASTCRKSRLLREMYYYYCMIKAALAGYMVIYDNCPNCSLALVSVMA